MELMKTLIFSAFIGASGLALVACGGGSSSTSATPAAAQGMLTQANSEAQLEATLKAGLQQGYKSLEGADQRLTFAVADSSTTTGSRTYILEAGVDESDLVKYDGEIMYTVTRGVSVCSLCSSIGPSIPFDTVNVLRTDVQNAQVQSLATIKFDDAHSIRGLYAPTQGQLIVLQSSSFYGGFGASWLLPRYWQNGEVTVSFYDTSNPEAPELSKRFVIDGVAVAGGSRLVDGKLYLVSRYTPALGYTPVDGPVITQIDELSLSDMLPSYRSDDSDTKTALFNATDCYVPNESSEQEVGTTITTVSVIPISDPSSMKSSCYTGSADGLYMSTKALYFAQNIVETVDGNYSESTTVHKFSLAGSESGVKYKGSATIDGVLGYGSQLDFRMSEHNDMLRIVTSQYYYDNGPVTLTVVNDTADDDGTTTADNVDHQLTILKESETSNELIVVSTLPNDTRSDEIGKPDERLYAVRFFGERAYLVTFKSIDPLYVLDLSNPADPRIAGELEVPGFSQFLHPVSNDLLLAIGSNTEESEFGRTIVSGLKLELFNTSDISAPTSQAVLNIGARFTSTEVFYDRHAFSFEANFNGSGDARFSLPIDVYSNGSNDGGYSVWNNSGLHLFEITDADDAAASTLRAVGQRITKTATDEQSYPSYLSERRSRFNGDALYFIENGSVTGSVWGE